MLAVAKLNDCRYCSWGHHEWAHIAGIPEEELAHIEDMDLEGFDRRKWVALSYVRAFVSGKFGSVPAGVTPVKCARTTPPMKSWRSSWSSGSWTSVTAAPIPGMQCCRGLKGNPAADSHIIDEAVLSGAFLVVAPAAVVYLAHASNRSYRETARSLIDYVKHYEERDSEEQVTVT